MEVSVILHHCDIYTCSIQQMQQWCAVFPIISRGQWLAREQDTVIKFLIDWLIDWLIDGSQNA